LLKTESTALLFVSDPDAAEKPKLRIMQELFGLSIAEGKLAAVVSTGRSVNEAAEELGVSANTVKTQLRSVFNKTGTSRQSQLMRLLSAIPPSRLP